MPEIKTICAWCGVLLHIRPVKGKDLVSHGICRACGDAIREEYGLELYGLEPLNKEVAHGQESRDKSS